MEKIFTEFGAQIVKKVAICAGVVMTVSVASYCIGANVTKSDMQMRQSRMAGEYEQRISELEGRVSDMRYGLTTRIETYKKLEAE